MKLVPVDFTNPEHARLLYELLAERTPEQSISHKAMPTWEEHLTYLAQMAPDHGVIYDRFLTWDLIAVGDVVGSIYLTQRNEIGISIFKRYQRQGFGSEAIELLMQQCLGGPFYANINPANEASRKMFEKLGFKTIQHTLALYAD